MSRFLSSGMAVLVAGWVAQSSFVSAQQAPPVQGQGQGQAQTQGQPAAQPAGRQGGGRQGGGGGTRGNAPLPFDNFDGYEKMFDGTSLKNWDGDPTFWRVENGTIVGESTEEKKVNENTFLIYRGGEPDNFELKFEFKMNSTNSGVQYRSKQLTGAINKWALCGYQADFDFANAYTGMLYEERGRTGFLSPRGTINYAPPNPGKIVQGQCTLNAPVVARAGGPAAAGRGQGGGRGEAGAAGGARAGDPARGGQAAAAPGGQAAGRGAPGAPAAPAGPVRQQIGTLEDGESLKQYVKVNDWNQFQVIARGNVLVHILNGHVTAVFIDDDVTNRAMKGLIGLQIHVGPPMKLELRNLYLKKLTLK
jgi:hypothetical protein